MKPIEVNYIALVATASLTALLLHLKQRRNEDQESWSAYESLIGKTPVVRLHRLSKKIKRSIYVKMESMNPGGTGKDRAALGMIQEAEVNGLLPKPFSNSTLSEQTKPDTDLLTEATTNPLDDIIRKGLQASRTGGLVVEGTSGSTGISLATLCVSRGHGCIVVLPDDQAKEKQIILETLGAIVHIVPTAAISNPNHYVNVARQLASRASNLFGIQAHFIDQFENVANYRTHNSKTGPEILRQCPGLSAFVMSSGTAGTIAGVGTYLKEKSWGTIKNVLVDPPGSSLYHKIEHGIAFTIQQSEHKLKRHRYDTLAEGIGLDRVTQNMALGLDSIDEAIRVTDQEAVDMAHWLLKNEGLWVGSSSAMNVVGAVRTAMTLPEDSKILTIICDSGQRHVTRFWNRDFIHAWGLEWPGDTERIPECFDSGF